MLHTAKKNARARASNCKKHEGTCFKLQKNVRNMMVLWSPLATKDFVRMLLRNFWRHFVRLGVKNGVSKRLCGELLCDVRAKNARVRASKHEITIFLPEATMYDNIFVFGTNFWRFEVI